MNRCHHLGWINSNWFICLGLVYFLFKCSCCVLCWVWLGGWSVAFLQRWPPPTKICVFFLIADLLCLILIFMLFNSEFKAEESNVSFQRIIKSLFSMWSACFFTFCCNIFNTTSIHSVFIWTTYCQIILAVAVVDKLFQFGIVNS